MKNSVRKLGLIAACVLVLEAPVLIAQDWPQWRGPNRDNKITGFTVPQAWPKDLMKKWKVTVGVGESSPVLVGDKLYVHARQGGDEVILCLDAASGKEIWKDKYATQPATGSAGNHPGPRSTPAVAEGKICAFGVRGILSCLDAATGKLQWREDTKAWPGFFTSASPLIVDGLCIIYQGTDKNGVLAAHDLTTGKQKWQWTAQGAPYGSPVLLTADGTRQVVTLTSKSIVGVSLDSGKLLWEMPFPLGFSDTTGTPIVDGQNVICFAQQAGAIALRIEKDRDGVTAKQVWKKSQSTHRFNTPVLRDGLLYGLTPGKLIFCMNAQTGETLWTDKTKRGECGTILNAGSVLLALTSDSDLLAIQPGDKGYRELAKYTVAESPTWAYPIIAGKRIYVKDRAGALTLWTLDPAAGD